MPTSYPSVTNAANASGAKPGTTSLVEAFSKAWAAVPKDAPAPEAPPDWKGEPENKPDDCAASLVAVAERWSLASRYLWPAWSESQGMCYSDQFGTFSWSARDYWQPRSPVPEKKLTRVQLNHIRSIAGDVASLQTQDELNLHCSPPADSSLAASSCEAGDALVSWFWERGNYDAINTALREAAAVTGTSFLHVQWDASAGEEVNTVVGYSYEIQTDPATGAPIGMVKKPVMARKRAGEPSAEMVSCFEVLPDPASKSEWDGEGIIIEQLLPIALLRRLYPDFKDGFVQDNANSAQDGSIYADRVKGIAPRGSGAYVGSSLAIQAERSRVQTIYMRSCPEFYRGRMAVVAHGKLVYLGDNPVYPTDEEEQKGETFPSYHWPVFRFAHNTVPGSYWGQGVVAFLIDLQKKLNGIASKILHMLKRTSHPVLVKPKRADFVKTDEPDQQINVAADIPPGAIYYLQTPGFPPELLQQEKYTVEQMEEIAGIHASSRGNSQPGNSGTKDRQLFQRDLGRLENTKRQSDRQMGVVMSLNLRYWRRYATTPRTIKVIGENLTTAVMSLDMASIAPGTDVIVYADLMMPKDPAGRMLHVKSAVEMGLVNPKDPIQGQGLARLLGFPGGEKMFEESLASDRRCAQNEDQKMYRGESPAVEFWHDHAQHLAAHYAEMNTDRWINACTPTPQDPPDVAQRKMASRKIFLDHVQFHQQALAALKATEVAQAVPKEIMNFKDLPSEGQTQMAGQAGIKLAPPKSPDGSAAPSPGPGPGAPPQSPPPNAQAGPPAQKQAA